MAQKHINTSAPNDNLGDTLRDANIKCEDNFTELYANKVDKISGKGLSTNDYTTAEKTKLAGIPVDAERNVQADFLVNDPDSDAYIKNKPNLITSVNWGDIQGDIANQYDLQAQFDSKPSFDYIDGKITQTITNGVLSNAPSEDAVFNALELKEDGANKNIASGYAGLDVNGKLFSNQLPALAISETFVVVSEAEMLSLTGAERGDIAVRTDVNKSFILKNEPFSTLANWQELLTPTDAVTSVFGRVGAVVANAGDYTTDLVPDTTNKRYQTDAQAARNDATSSIQNQLNSKAIDSTVLHKTGNEIFEGVKSATNTGNGLINGISLTNNSTFAPVLQLVNAGNGTGANILNTLGIGLQIQNEANNGYGLTIGHNSNGRAINISSTKNGQGIYVANLSGGTGAQIDNFSDGLGLHINNNNDVDATGLKITNNGINKGLEILNNKAGHGISLENRESGTGIYITNGTGTGLGTGISLQNIGNRNGIGISNTGSGLGIININSSNGVGARFENNSTGVGVQIRANGSGTGNLFEAIKDNVVVTQIDTNGNIWTRTPNDGDNSTRVATTAFVRNNSVGGIGGTNTIPKFTALNTIGSSQIIDNGTGVGIGIAPTGKFDVNVGSDIVLKMIDNVGYGELAATNSSNSDFKDLSLNAKNFIVKTNNGTTKMVVNSAGNVAIGSSTAGAIGGYTNLLIGDNEGNKAGLIKFKSTYNGGDGANIYQDASTGNVYIDINNSTNGVTITSNGSLKSRSIEYEAGINIGATNLNNLTRAGFFIGSEMVNAPNEYWWYVISEIHDGGGYRKQTATSYGGGANPLAGGTTYIRVYTDGANWGTWQQVITGSGSLPTSGAYTPTVVAGGNTSSISLLSANYTKVGNIVNVMVAVTFTITSPSTISNFSVTAPFTRATSSSNYYVGNANVRLGSQFVPATLQFLGSNAQVRCDFMSMAGSGTPAQAILQFQYDLTV